MFKALETHSKIYFGHIIFKGYFIIVIALNIVFLIITISGEFCTQLSINERENVGLKCMQ